MRPQHCEGQPEVAEHVRKINVVITQRKLKKEASPLELTALKRTQATQPLLLRVFARR